jgi:3D (Asp-Asp-Asp) domain-containing protein
MEVHHRQRWQASLLCLSRSFATKLVLTSAIIVALACWYSDAEEPTASAEGLGGVSTAVPASEGWNWVRLQADGGEREILTASTTVRDLLSEASITLSPLDRVRPSPASRLTAGMTVIVERITQEKVNRTIALPPKAISRFDPRVRAGAPLVLDPGRPGSAQAVLLVSRKNGVEVSSKVLQQRVIHRSRPQIVLRGRSQPSRGYLGRKSLSVVATAYDPGPRSCGKYADGWTAIGLKAGKGVIAVDPRVIPLGTRVYIDGYGYAIAGDVGGAIKGNRIDLGFDTYREAIQFGRRRVTVHLLD